MKFIILLLLIFRLDYCGIALLTMGSFVPWLYYSFYCRTSPKVAYLCLIFVLGILCIVVAMWDKFSEPGYRPVRAGKHLIEFLKCNHDDNDDEYHDNNHHHLFNKAFNIF